MLDGPYFAEGTPAMVELESMVDKVGLSNVLYALAHIAFMKAEHLQIRLTGRTRPARKPGKATRASSTLSPPKSTAKAASQWRLSRCSPH